MNELIAILLAWTVGQTGYADPPQLPDIIYEPHRELVAAVCPTAQRSCRPFAYYADGSNTISLNSRLRNRWSVRTQAILVHEMVHYLQDLNGQGRGTTCHEIVAREREAYRAQIDYLIDQGVNPAAIARPQLSTDHCEPRIDRSDVALARQPYLWPQASGEVKPEHLHPV